MIMIIIKSTLDNNYQSITKQVMADPQFSNRENFNTLAPRVAKNFFVLRVILQFFPNQFFAPAWLNLFPALSN